MKKLETMLSVATIAIVTLFSTIACKEPTSAPYIKDVVFTSTDKNSEGNYTTLTKLTQGDSYFFWANLNDDDKDIVSATIKAVIGETVIIDTTIDLSTLYCENGWYYWDFPITRYGTLTVLGYVTDSVGNTSEIITKSYEVAECSLDKNPVIKAVSVNLKSSSTKVTTIEKNVDYDLVINYADGGLDINKLNITYTCTSDSTKVKENKSITGGQKYGTGYYGVPINFTDAGTWDITVTLSDNEGNVSNSFTTTVTVE